MFSTSGVLSDVNMDMDPTHLGRLVYVSKNWYLYADNISVKTLFGKSISPSTVYVAASGSGRRKPQPQALAVAADADGAAVDGADQVEAISDSDGE